MFISTMVSIFGQRKLKPAWEFTVSALIWRVFFAPQGKIIGESRSQDTKTATFFCIDAKNGRPLWRDLRFDEPWWIGIETVHQNWLILHGFSRPDMPEHKGIRVVDINSGNIRWRNDDLTFWFIKNDKLYAYKYLFDKRIGYGFDIQTGTIVDEYIDDLDILHAMRKEYPARVDDPNTTVAFPYVYDEAQANQSLRLCMDTLTHGKTLESWIEYFVRQEILIVSYYRKEQNEMQNIIVIYNMNRRSTIYESVLNNNLPAPSPDTFFIKDEYLYFIKNKNTLTALQPWTS
jgi:hypothetical protein